MSKPKKKTGLIIGILAGVILLGGGGVVGAATFGFINIPGLTPSQKTADMYGEGSDMYGESPEDTDLKTKVTEKKDPVVKKTKPTTPPPTPKEPEPEIDPEKGAKKLAGVWNNMDASVLQLISAEYKPKDLALILNKMEPEKVADLLALLSPKEAASISKEMQALNSIIPTADS